MFQSCLIPAVVVGEQFDRVIVVAIVVYVKDCKFTPGTCNLRDYDIARWEV